MARQWSINGRFLAQPVTGVQRYANEIVSALDQLVAEGHPGTDGLDLELLVPPDAKCELALTAISTRSTGKQSGQVWEQSALPAAARGRGLINLCNTAPLAHGREIVCIHDLNTRLAPQSYTPAFRLYYQLMMPAIGKRAREIATVSSFSAKQIAAYRIAPASKITVIPNGHEHALRWRAKHTPQTAAAASAHTIVLLGSPAPHKNARLILDSAVALENAGFKIAVAGVSDPAVFAGAPSRIEAANISWLGRVDDAALAALLRDSLCLAFPSLTEGFGLPPLEAMAIGCPVVASDCASLPEVCGDAALYASPHDPASWVNAFERIRGEAGLRERLQAAGRKQAATFSWRKSAERYLQMLARLDNIAWPQTAAPALPAAAE